jgi:hypothetical protein
MIFVLEQLLPEKMRPIVR